jgi:histone acetyltransferase 1
MGYEGLSIDIRLSQKFLIPLVKISYEKKAPECANIDDIEEKLRSHYGKIYTDAALY